MRPLIILWFSLLSLDKSQGNGHQPIRRLSLLRHRSGRNREAPGLRRQCPEVPDTISKSAGRDPRDGADEFGRQGWTGQDPGEGKPGGTGLRNMAAKADDQK